MSEQGVASGMRYWTEQEFLGLPETRQRMELLDGDLICEPSPGYGHQESTACFSEILRAWARTLEPAPTVALGPLDIRFSPGRILQPDVCIFLQPLPRDVKTPIAQIPDLCIEVVSQRRDYDRMVKRLVYAQAGVRELWTVLRHEAVIERWSGEGLAFREVLGERVTSPLLPGFDAAVADLIG